MLLSPTLSVQQLSVRTQELAEATRRGENGCAKAREAHAAALLAAKEERLAAEQELRAEWRTQKQAQEQAHTAAVAALDAKVAALTAETARLTEMKHAMDNVVRELRHKESDAVRRLEANAAAADRLSSLLRELREEHAALETDSGRLRVEAAELAQRVEARDGVIAGQEKLLATAQGHRATLESACQQQDAQVETLRRSLQASAAEIHRGNSIIEQLDAEVGRLRKNVRARNALVLRQEQELERSAAATRQHETELVRLRGALERSETQLEHTTVAVADKSRQVDEAAAALRKSEKVISYLNKELTLARVAPGKAPGRAFAASATRRWSGGAVAQPRPYAQRAPLQSPALSTPEKMDVSGTLETKYLMRSARRPLGNAGLADRTNQHDRSGEGRAKPETALTASPASSFFAGVENC